MELCPLVLCQVDPKTCDEGFNSQGNGQVLVVIYFEAFRHGSLGDLHVLV